MNEFLSRFVYIMRSKVSEAYPNCNKETIDGMLAVIVQKVVLEMEKGSINDMLNLVKETQFQDFSQELWRAVWEVCNFIVEDMRKMRKREELKKHLQCEEVKEMCKFAQEVGIRGDMLKELRLKWAQEKMAETEFYRGLEQMREEENALSDEDVASSKDGSLQSEEGERVEGENAVGEETQSFVLPKRKGKIQYKIYGLDLSGPKWREVAERLEDAEKLIAPQETKEIEGKCKLVMDKMLSLSDDEDPYQLLVEWEELLEPARIDWLALLERLKEKNKPRLCFKVAELVLDKKSFEPNIRDFSKLIDAHAKEDRIADAERILGKMTEKGISPDILTYMTLVHMYSNSSNLDLAKQAFEDIRARGFQPDQRIYNSMIMAYIKAGLPKSGESLMREMEARDIRPTKQIYMELLRAFAQGGHVDGAQRIVNTMQFAGFQPDLESCSLLVEAYGHAGDPEQARNNYDYMIKAGHKPDDKCTASLLAAYEKKNLLDKALGLLLHLEREGYKLGTHTYAVLVDWLGRLQLVAEVEQVLSKIGSKEEVPFKVHVSLCDMYARARVREKALEALGIVEEKKEALSGEEFERVIHGLLAGGFVQEARRVHEGMQGQGFVSSDPLKVALMAAQAMPRQKPVVR
ncbi:hypothetical protein AMTR_s00011p00240280 [Amborella trichopoda]|uniref:PROP1-like PPR domain-containing protein n=2 Tax=Amborella trichopoda TaxID=13333 RepID=W1NGY6_AMBTC|nr:hypothetical protein AMTR_s00011p00240280 [Amborella trichopoda]